MNQLVEIFADNKTNRFTDSDFPLRIGSGPGTHINLPGTAPLAALVAESRGHLFLQPDRDGTGKIYHNDEYVESSVWIKSGDITRIGDQLISWHKNGDIIQATVGQTTPPLTPPPLSPDRAAPLPRVCPSDKKKARSRLTYFLAALFILLLCCAGFILAAKPVRIVINPPPDSLKLTGFPPAFHLGDRFVGLPGNYVVRAEKEGYTPLRQKITINATIPGYEFKMEKLPGLLSLDSIPPGVTVEIDGQPVGHTPLAAIEVAMGRHKVTFSHPRYFSLEKSIEISGAGEKQNLAVTLDPAWAWITINSKPQGARLFVDGREVGITPATLEPVAGNHEIRLQKEKFTDFNASFTVAAGEKRTLPPFHLIPAPGQLILSTTPDKISVSVDAVFQGKTPLTLTLAAGVSHVIDLMAPGFKAIRKKITMQAAEEKSLAISLDREFGTIFFISFPAEAILYVDGKKQGPATTSLHLTTRSHNLEIKAAGYEKWQQRITPQAGISQRLEIHLKRKATAADNRKNSGPTEIIKTVAGQKMVLVRPAVFTMGASRAEPGRRANEREHKVILQRPFYLAVKEVTNAEFRLFMPGHTSGSVANRSLDNDDMPVVNVTWDETARYLNQLSKKDGLPPFYHEENGKMRVTSKTGTGYRLPTEAEWAYVARVAGRPKQARYPWPGSFPPTSIVGNFADESARHIVPQIINGYNDSFPALAPVASFAPGPMGFFDMGGNAAEWCHDFYSANMALGKQQIPDPLGPETGSHHLIRGSSWRDGGITELRFSYRRYSRQAADDIGFRFARYAR